MFLTVTIVILFLYTVILIVVFMGWCTLLPKMCHPRPNIPLCHIASPRRHTAFTDFESLPSSRQSFDLLHRRLSIPSDEDWQVGSVKKPDDYLHPKYSLPPIKPDIMNHLWEYEQLLRTPVHVHRSPSPRSEEKAKHCVIEIDVKAPTVV